MAAALRQEALSGSFYKHRNQSRIPHLGQIFIIRSLIQDFKLELHKVLNEQVQKAGNNLRSSQGSQMRNESAHGHAGSSSSLPSEAACLAVETPPHQGTLTQWQIPISLHDSAPPRHWTHTVLMPRVFWKLFGHPPVMTISPV